MERMSVANNNGNISGMALIPGSSNTHRGLATESKNHIVGEETLNE